MNTTNCSFSLIDDEIDYIIYCFKKVDYTGFIIDKIYFKIKKKV